MGPLNLVLKLIFASLLYSLVISCGMNLKYDQISPKASGGDLNSIPPSPFLSEAGEESPIRDIRDNRGRPTVLFFSSTTCGPCSKEHKEILKYLNGRTPSQVNLYTFMVGAREDSPTILKWRNKLGISWPIGMDNKKNIMKKFCDKNLTPCTVIFNEKKEVIFTAQRSDIKIEEIFKHTGGPWFKEEGPGENGNTNPPPEAPESPLLSSLFQCEKDYKSIIPAEFKSEEKFYFINPSSLHPDKKLLLLVASTECGACTSEHEEIFNKKEEILQYAKIVTFMTDFFWEDVKAKFPEGLNWPMIIDNDFFEEITRLFKPKMKNDLYPPMIFIIDKNNKILFYSFDKEPLEKIMEELKK